MDSMQLSIVYIHAGPAGLIEQALSSLMSTPLPANWEVLVVHNGATTSESELAQIPGIRYFPLQYSTGYGKCCNFAALHVARGKHIAFVHNNILLTKDFVEQVLQSQQELGVHGVVTSGKEASLSIDFTPWQLVKFWNNQITRSIDYHTTPHKMVKLPTLATQSDDFFMVQRQEFLNSGGFDQSFFYYLEVSDYVKRVEAQGHKFLYQTFPLQNQQHHTTDFLGAPVKRTLFLISLLSTLYYLSKHQHKYALMGLRTLLIFKLFCTLPLLLGKGKKVRFALTYKTLQGLWSPSKLPSTWNYQHQ
jgi:GT2 family glycosyltransferase